MAKEGTKIRLLKRYIVGTGKDQKVFEAGKEYVVSDEQLKEISKGDYEFPGEEKK